LTPPTGYAYKVLVQIPIAEFLSGGATMRTLLLLGVAALALASCGKSDSDSANTKAPPPPSTSPAAKTPDPQGPSSTGNPADKVDGIKGTKRPGPITMDQFNDRPKVAPKRGGDLVQAMHVNFKSLDSWQDTGATTQEVVHMYVQEALVSSDEETWEVAPRLAHRWDIEDNLDLNDGKSVRGIVKESADGYDVSDLQGKAVSSHKKADVKGVRYKTSFTFHLRKDVVFHNGQPFTAKDVEWSLNLVRNPKNGMPNIQSYFNEVNECAVIDDYTVRISYSKQYWMALMVCGGYLYVRPHKAWDPEGLLMKDPDSYFKTFTSHPLMLAPIGTGPYQFESMKKDVEVVLSRNEKYWGATGRTAPSNGQWPDRLRFRIIKDPVAQIAALKNNEVDYIYQVPPEQFDEFFKDEDNRKKFAKVEIVYTVFHYIGFNMRKELWKDRNLRMAISYAHADMEKFNRENMLGRAERVWSPNYRYADFHNNDIKPLPYDPKKAEDMLAESGWYDSDGDGILDKDGKKLEFEILTREVPNTVPIMQHLLIMEANLKKLGIKMTIRKMEWAGLLDASDKGNFDVIRLGWALSSPPSQQDNYQIWHSSQTGDQGSNHIAYANKEVDSLLENIRTELSPEKRKQMQLRLQEVIFNDHAYIFLWMPSELRIYNKKWRGVRFYVPRPAHNLNEWYQE
jgi:peptide/nickel transport system substrate-binding protein